jgi:hypothetical protein
MALTIDEVKHGLRADEPDYDVLAARWGKEALPFLAMLAKSPDRTNGPRAVYLAGKIGNPLAAAIVSEATGNPDPLWKLAAAGAAEYLTDVERIKVVSILLKDTDVGVRKIALNSIPNRVDRPLRELLDEIAKADPADALRKLAQQVIARTHS